MNRKNLTAAVLAGMVLRGICIGAVLVGIAGSAQAKLSDDVYLQWSGHDGGNARGVVDNVDANLSDDMFLSTTKMTRYEQGSVAHMYSIVDLHPVHGYTAGTDCNLIASGASPEEMDLALNTQSLPAIAEDGISIVAARTVDFDGERKITGDSPVASVSGLNTGAANFTTMADNML